MEKYKYDISLVQGNSLPFLQSYINSVNRRCGLSASSSKQDEEVNEARLIYNYIMDNDVRRVTDILPYILDNGLYSTWRRGASTFKDIIKENRESAVLNETISDLRTDFNQSYQLQNAIIDKQSKLLGEYQRKLSTLIGTQVTLSLDEDDKLTTTYRTNRG